ncbi:hypothetical protein Desdi_2452 [Desulfitobacterium dichloroeliminans LMG P-21439]|uniref:Uncharacterized protein n=1 Tax=Desulfitobacterium dichloroeliminans (strain LMG P-21439 / DCA1) TaxID=871963 RepID=L0FB38_DESDL|nr:hypothetical protein [Desulfitobacterium dichloroeliminans]AGA69876.1 hypothetical protein Desdi_2452 [Desulfitobacterium dichloroeliminans LMG P-21439]
MARKNQGARHRELGYITLLMLVLLATLSAYGLEMYVQAHGENKIARKEVSSRQAVYGAESGIEWVKVKLREDPSFSEGDLRIGDGNVHVQVVGNEGRYALTSSAHYGQIKRKIKVILLKVDEQWEIEQYQEIHGDE